MSVAAFPSSPILRWYGGAYDRAPWTVSFLPPHESYYEPFVGAGSVLGHKPPSTFETVTDTHGRLVNLLTMIRDRKEELVEKIALTPWAEAEWALGQEQAEDKLEDARRFWFVCWSSIRGGPPEPANSFTWNRKPGSRYTSHAASAHRHDLLRWSDRLRNVQILNRSAFDVLPDFLKEDALIYADPPYLQETRKRKDGYLAHEFTEEQHRQLAALLRQHAGCAVIAGYKSDLYAELYEEAGWIRKDREFQTNSGSKAIESLWLNPLTVKRSDLPLFPTYH